VTDAIPTIALSSVEFATLQRLARLSGRWGYTRRRRRLAFLGLAAPGFFAVFTTPLHQTLAVLVLGLVLFAAACAVRARTERIFTRAEAAAVWPPLDHAPQSEMSHGS